MKLKKRFIAQVTTRLNIIIRKCPLRSVQTSTTTVIMAESDKMSTGIKKGCDNAATAASEDCEWERDDGEEEQLVLIELFGTFTDDLVKDPDLRAKFIGLDTARPMVQLGNQGLNSQKIKLALVILQHEHTIT